MTTQNLNAITVLLVDDHRVMRAGLRILLEQMPGLVVIGEADNQEGAIGLATKEQPNIILLDLDLNGISSLQFLPQLTTVAPSSRVILLTGLRDSAQHRQAIGLGAKGVVLKDQVTDVLVKAIEKVHAGEVWLDRMTVAAVLNEMSRPPQPEVVDPDKIRIASLTERERGVIELICQGLQNTAIGDRLAISEPTVRHHLTSIFSKLGLESRLELVIYAYKHNLIKPPS